MLMRAGRILRFVFAALSLGSAGAAELRIVSQSPALTELVCHLGRDSRLVGRSEACDHPKAIQKLPCTGRFNDPDPERVLLLKPTHFIADGLVRPAATEALRRAGIKVLIQPCRNLAEYLAWVDLIGREFGCPQEAAQESARIRAFQAECANWPQLTEKVLWVIWDAPLIVAGEGSLPAELLRLAGAVNAAGDVKQAYFKASREWLLLHPPEAVVWSVSASPAALPEHPFWSKLAAVRRGKVIAVPDPDLVLRPGPRLPDGVRLLRRALEKLP